MHSHFKTRYVIYSEIERPGRANAKHASVNTRHARAKERYEPNVSFCASDRLTRAGWHSKSVSARSLVFAFNDQRAGYGCSPASKGKYWAPGGGKIAFRLISTAA